MTRLLAALSPAQLEGVASAIERGAPTVAVATDLGQSLTPSQLRDAVAEIEGLMNEGTAQLARTLRAVAAERRESTRLSDRRIELVWTGPEREGAGTRDTSVVVRDLFMHAESFVLVSGYALYNAREILEPLAARMQERPAMRARFFLNLQRRDGDGRSTDDLAVTFARLLAREWPGDRMPDVYYDPRSLETNAEKRAVLHAKCIVVDDRRAFITSANITEAAHQRNIELGVLLNDPHLATGIRMQFDNLVDSGELLPLGAS